MFKHKMKTTLNQEEVKVIDSCSENACFEVICKVVLEHTNASC